MDLNDKLQRIWKEQVVIDCKFLFNNLPGRMVENDEIPSVCRSLIWSVAKAPHSATCFDTIWPF